MILNKKFFCSAIFAILFFVAGAETVTAQQSTDPAEIKKLRVAIEKNPDDLELHEEYQKAVGRKKLGAPEFIAQYEAWMKKFPKSATVAYTLGHTLAERESPKAKPYLLKAVELNPRFDKAYYDLWMDAERWGDRKAATAYILKAKEADPKNTTYAFHYAWAFKRSDPEKYKKLLNDMVSDFSNTEAAAQALYQLAYDPKDINERITYYEQVRRDYPAGKFDYGGYAMREYFGLIWVRDPAKGLEVAEYMASLKPEGDKTWEVNKNMAKGILEAKSLLKDGKAADAVIVLEKLVLPRYVYAKDELLLLKAQALDAAGKTEKAYQTLLVAFAMEPVPTMEEEMISYGSKLGKNPVQIDKDLWYIRDTAAKVAPVFVLDQYLKKGTASLADYKGKVVLLTYWFPGCGPCRGEFPHFENVVRKFKGKDFAYIGINIIPDQDEYVVPFVKSTGYSFTPLRDNKNWKKGPLDNRGAAPTNFLIDENGKIIFSKFSTDARNEATLEKMISSLLARKKMSS